MIFVAFVVHGLRRPGRATLLLFALCCWSCAPSIITLPTGTGAPAVDGAEVVREATKACRALKSLTAEIAASGTVTGRRIRVRLLAGLAPPASVRLEAIAPFGQPLFVFAGREDDATLLLPRDRRILEHGRPDAVLETVAGVPLGGADLRLVLTGCVLTPRTDEARRFGDAWRVLPEGSGDVYLHREPRGPWRVVAAVRNATGAASWRSEYRDFHVDGAAAGLPATVRLMSADRKRFDLRLALTQVELNTVLDATTFEIQKPRDVAPITLEELKQSGPLSNP